MAEHLESGRAAERIAKDLLEQSGLHAVAANYRCRFGELDLVMTDRDTLVIVEVRYRRRPGFIQPALTVTREKIRRVVRTTQHFVQRHRRWRDAPIRFDIVGVSGSLHDANMNWIRDAFTIDGLFDRR